jgi:predicted DNA-binding transcriptional regulator AlpA
MSAELAAAYVGLSVTTILATAEFPPPVWLTKGRRVWLRDDLDAWLDRKAGRVEIKAPRPEDIS